MQQAVYNGPVTSTAIHLSWSHVDGIQIQQRRITHKLCLIVTLPNRVTEAYKWTAYVGTHTLD